MDAINTILLLYCIYRLHLNGTAPKSPIRVVAPSNAVQEWQKQIENFEPKKPETLRPNQVRGRDIQGVENVIEFDVKIVNQ